MVRYYKGVLLATVLIFCALRGTNVDGARQGKAAPTPKPIPTVSSPATKVTPAKETAPTATPTEEAVPTATATAHPTVMPASGEIANASPANSPGNLFIAEVAREMRLQQGLSTTDAPLTELASQTNGQSTLRYIGQTLISLAFVIFLILAFAWLTKKYLVKTAALGGGYIDLLGSFSLSPKSKIHLVRVGNEHYLLGEGANSVSLISRINASAAPLQEEELPLPLPDDDPQPLTSFGDRLKDWQGALEGKSIRPQVNASLLLLGALSKRLKRKGEQGDG